MREIVKVFVIGILGLAGLLVPVGYVQALDNSESCAKQGFILCKDLNCGSHKCVCEAKAISPGEDCIKHLGGKVFFFQCDGCTGALVAINEIRPGAAPQPGAVLQPGTAPTPSGGVNLPGRIAPLQQRK